jgi:hypothetical protein
VSTARGDTFWRRSQPRGNRRAGDASLQLLAPLRETYVRMLTVFLRILRQLDGTPTRTRPAARAHCVLSRQVTRRPGPSSATSQRAARSLPLRRCTTAAYVVLCPSRVEKRNSALARRFRSRNQTVLVIRSGPFVNRTRTMSYPRVQLSPRGSWTLRMSADAAIGHIRNVSMVMVNSFRTAFPTLGVSATHRRRGGRRTELAKLKAREAACGRSHGPSLCYGRWRW